MFCPGTNFMYVWLYVILCILNKDKDNGKDNDNTLQ